MGRRNALWDEQWEQIKDTLSRPTAGVTARDNWLYVEAMLYAFDLVGAEQ
ncbi:MAG: hypothetical protein V2J55_18725 [Candidatus Competibacteraceae bacterium]|jgi:hypothetical protein|nr:hypothetical protein [Candidatus Competibacteraceae bacterium]